MRPKPYKPCLRPGALSLSAEGAVGPAARRRYKLTTKVELATNAGKAPRNFQVPPQPSRTLELGPYWAAWSAAMKGHHVTVKGQTVWDRTQQLQQHMLAHQMTLLGGGDISAWDASWSFELRSVSAELDRLTMGERYSDLTSDRYAARAAHESDCEVHLSCPPRVRRLRQLRNERRFAPSNPACCSVGGLARSGTRAGALVEGRRRRLSSCSSAT